LTPSQLARKRANDREAQRAIRARTKEHIERLERELEDLKGKHNRDDTVQDLIKRNKALETELKRLRESMGIPHTDPYPNSGERRRKLALTMALRPNSVKCALLTTT
jgi:regulator of replication initiation timing